MTIFLLTRKVNRRLLTILLGLALFSPFSSVRSEVIVDLPEGGRGDVVGWNGQLATRYEGVRQSNGRYKAPVIEIELDEPLDPPFSVTYIARRYFLGELSYPIGSAKVVTFTSQNHSTFARSDIGEAHQFALRSRHLGYQNGSTPANSGESYWVESTWHYCTTVFDTWNENRNDDSNTGLYAYLDDNPASIRGKNKEGAGKDAPKIIIGLLPAGFDKVEIGAGIATHRVVLDVQDLIIQKGVLGPDDAIELATANSLPYKSDDIPGLTADGRIVPYGSTKQILQVVNAHTGGKAQPDIGNTVTFTVTVTNNSASSMSGEVIKCLIPSKLTPTSNNGSISNGSYNSTTGDWTVTVAPGASETLTIEGTVNALGTITNKATYEGFTHDEAFVKTANTSVDEFHNVTIKNGTGEGEYLAGERVNIEADTAPEGKQFKEWDGNGDEDLLDNKEARETFFTMPERNVTLEAKFMDIPQESKESQIKFVNRLEKGDPLIISQSMFPSPGKITVKVFDRNGRVIKEITTTGDVNWDGRLSNGKHLPSGTYILQIEHLEGTIKTKISMLK